MVNSIVQRLLDLYEEHSNSAAIHLLVNQEPDHAVTYSDLIHGSAGYAKALKDLGINPGEVVILILQHSEALIFAFFGCILNGSIPSIMPFLTEKLSPEQYRRSLIALFEITSPAAVITYPEFLDEVNQAIKPGSSVRKILVSDQVFP
jgi:polyketide synthase PksJ